MAERNDTPTLHLYGLAIDLSGQKPADIREAAKAMTQAVEVALFEATPNEQRTLESSEQAALIGLLVATRSAIDAAETIDKAKRRPIAV